MAIDKLNLTRIRNVKLPERGTPGSAGLDVFIPFDLVRLDFNKMAQIIKIEPRVEFDINNGYLKNIFLNPGEGVLVPSGLKIKVPEGYVLKVENKSSVASIKDCVVGACVIDSDFEGEILINVHNISKSKIAVFNPGDKIAQMVLYKIETPVVNEIATPVELFKDNNSERGQGGFGSTGKK